MKNKLLSGLYMIFLLFSSIIPVYSIYYTFDEIFKYKIEINYDKSTQILQMNAVMHFTTYLYIILLVISIFTVIVAILIWLNIFFTFFNQKIFYIKMLHLGCIIIIILLFFISVINFILNSGFDSIG
jgi:hypothetical protein